jgi:hypothetical protein
VDFWNGRHDVLLLDLENDEALPLIKLYVESSAGYRLTRLGLDEAGDRAKLKKVPFESAILNCDYVGREEVEHLTLLSIRLGERPILVCANQVALQSYRFVDRFPNIVMLQKPFTAARFKDLFARISAGTDYRPKVCPRFMTNEPVNLVILKSGKSVTSRMLNYSAGGMFVEIEGADLSVGDQVQISLPANPAGTRAGQNHFSGRIIWRRPPDEKGVSGVGLQLV